MDQVILSLYKFTYKALFQLKIFQLELLKQFIEDNKLDLN